MRRDVARNEAEKRLVRRKRIILVLSPCNPLKSHKIAKDLFGNAWSKTADIWKSLQKSLAAVFIPPLLPRLLVRRRLH